MTGWRPRQVNIPIALIIVFIQCLSLFCLAPPSVFGSNFIDFYSKAEARNQSPPDLSRLSILCRKKKFPFNHVTFVGGPDKKVILVVFTMKRVKDLSKVITLKPVFVQDSKDLPPAPSANVGPDATLDWAYVYDRNGDGKVDYLAFLFGALSFKPEDFPSNFPTGGRIDSFEQYELMLTQTRLFFGHYADDNFDGATDAVVAAVLDPDRYPWAEQFGVLRSTEFNGKVDDTWMFKKDISQRTGTVAMRGQKYILQNAPDAEIQTAKELFDFGTRIMKTTNDFAGKCELGKGAFMKE